MPSLRAASILSFLLVLGAVPGLQAQTARSRAMTDLTRLITEDDLRRDLGVIAHDSMMGRATPSRGLDLTAQYVADQFASFGLRPGGDNGTWFQRYPLEANRFDAAGSSLTLTRGSTPVTLSFSRDALRVFGSTSGPVEGSVMLIGGGMTPENLATVEVKDHVVLLVQGETRGAAARLPFLLLNRGARAVITAPGRGDSDFRARVRGQSVVQTGGGGRRGAAGPVVEVQDAAIRDIAGVDLAAIRGDKSLVVRPVEGLTAALTMIDTSLDPVHAPNTVGILEGSDPVLRNEYVVFSAHMDHIGIRSGQPDSIANGADDDGSGTVGVIALARAMSRMPVRPKRSILFLTVSGEERGLLGSAWYAEHPTVPLDRIVANINLDMIGRNWPDSIVAIGKEHSDLGKTLERVNARHPELGMTAIDDRWPQENFYGRSDHFNFARKGVPILFFFNGTHADYHQVSDSPDKINYEKMARIVRLLYHLGEEVANASERPAWNPESRRRIVEGAAARP
jgi:hypothetical protein